MNMRLVKKDGTWVPDTSCFGGGVAATVQWDALIERLKSEGFVLRNGDKVERIEVKDHGIVFYM